MRYKIFKLLDNGIIVTDKSFSFDVFDSFEEAFSWAKAEGLSYTEYVILPYVFIES